MTSYPNKTLVCCGFCGHWCNRDHSEYPLEDTPPEKICVRLGDRRISMLCSNPSCHGYTIYCLSSSEVERTTEKYKLK